MELQQVLTYQQYLRDTQTEESESRVRVEQVSTVAAFGQGRRADGEAAAGQAVVALARARVEGTGGGERAVPLPGVWNRRGDLSGLRHDTKCYKLYEENRDVYIC